MHELAVQWEDLETSVEYRGVEEGGVEVERFETIEINDFDRILSSSDSSDLLLEKESYQSTIANNVPSARG